MIEDQDLILADTSAWIEHDRATLSAVDERMIELIASDGPLAYTEPVMMEMLAGARADRLESKVRRLLMRFTLLPFESPTDFVGAADVFRRCRAAGVTPGGMIDCMIAHVALRTNATVLSNDVGMARMALVLGVRLDQASLRAS